MGTFSKQQLSPLPSFLPIEGISLDFKDYAQSLKGKKTWPFIHSLSLRQGKKKGCPGRNPKLLLAIVPSRAVLRLTHSGLPTVLPAPHSLSAALTLNMSFQPLVLPESRVSGRARPALLMQMSTPRC